MIDRENEDCPIETSEDEAEPFVIVPHTLSMAARLERAEKALLAGGFTLTKDGHWTPPTSPAASAPAPPKTGVLTNADLVELTGGLSQGAAQIRWIKQYLKIDAPRKADGHPLLTWRQLGHSDDVPSTRSKINWTKP